MDEFGGAWFEHARALLLSGDAQGYRQLCGKLSQRFQENCPVEAAHLLARTCALSPDSGVDPARILSWAEAAIGQRRNRFTLLALAAAEYRAGRFEEAIKRLEELDALPDAHRSNIAFLFALAHHRLGHDDESRQWYDVGLKSLRDATPSDPDAPTAWAVSHWLNANVWRQLAKVELETDVARNLVGGAENDSSTPHRRQSEAVPQQ